MDWKLIFELSLFGLAMAIATVFAIPSNVEPAFWLVIFLICAYVIARRRQTGHFTHGVVLGLANSVWITAAHILLFERYIAGHAQEAAMMKSMPLPDSPRLMMAIFGPAVGLVSGMIIGLLALAAGKFIKPTMAPTAKTIA
jgi:thiamine transporter ThiT